MSATWKSRLPEFKRADAIAQKTALEESAEVYETAMKVRLERGITTGAFTTGDLADSVTHSVPHRERDGWVTRVGSPVGIARAWELGHHNIFTGRFERVEIWRPVLVEQRNRIAKQFSVTYRWTVERSV